MEKNAPCCVSIYLPMDKKGKEQNLHLAQGVLKQCIKEVEESLSGCQMSPTEKENYLNPLFEILNETRLWRNPSEGLAIFLSPEDGIQHYQLPIPFAKQTYVAGHHYLVPLLPLYHNNDLYYILELSSDYVNLYEAWKYGFRNLFIEDFAPDRLEKAVGFDYKPKMLQFRSGQDLVGGGAFHGHGEGKDDAKKELVKFFRSLDKGVTKAIGNQNVPLVLACTDYLAHVYKETNSYPRLVAANISGDPEFKAKGDLHMESLSVMEGYFEETQNEKAELFDKARHTAKVSTIIDDIIKAALHGKVDTLFIAEGTDVFGTYNAKENRVTLQDQRDPHNISLTNLAAMETFRQGGKVYFLPLAKMPVKESSINALFRY